MSNVIYISKKLIRVVSGHKSSCGYYVENAQDIELLNDESNLEVFKEELISKLSELKSLKDVTLILNVQNFFWKVGEIPVVKSNHLAREIVKKELEDMTDASKEYVYDYRLALRQDTVGIRVLMFAIEKEKLEFYLNVFNEVGIKLKNVDVSLNCLIKVYEYLFSSRHTGLGFIDIEKNEINTVLFVEGKFRYYGKDTIEPGTDMSRLRNQLINKVSQLIQFQRGNFRDSSIEKIIISGLESEEFDIFENTLQNLFQIRVVDLLKLKKVNDYRQGLVELGALKED